MDDREPRARMLVLQLLGDSRETRTRHRLIAAVGDALDRATLESIAHGADEEHERPTGVVRDRARDRGHVERFGRQRDALDRARCAARNRRQQRDLAAFAQRRRGPDYLAVDRDGEPRPQTGDPRVALLEDSLELRHGDAGLEVETRLARADRLARGGERQEPHSHCRSRMVALEKGRGTSTEASFC